jgi:hypothetical protein
MSQSAARNLRSGERYLLAPPLAASFGALPVSLSDISRQGARFRHDRPLENGAKAVLQIPVEGQARPAELEAVVVWTQPGEPGSPKHVSGVRTYAAPELIADLFASLQMSRRTHRIEELRSTDRFNIPAGLPATFNGLAGSLEDLSARGARIELAREPSLGTTAALRFDVPESLIEVNVHAQVVWTSLKAITGSATRTYRAGLAIGEKPELLRLAIGHLCEMNLAALDVKSLRLKLKIMRARARQMAPSFRQIEASGIPAEQYLLIQGVREELRLNPDEAMHWYRRARLVINDPATRTAAPPIAHHPDALAVWEYLDRSIDPTIVGRAFELPSAG